MNLKPYAEAGVVPRPILEALWRYHEKRVPLNPFLQAVVKNDFLKAVLLASPSAFVVLQEIAKIVANEMCPESHGSARAYEKWIAAKEAAQPAALVIPGELAGDRFETTWKDWVAYRRERNLPCQKRTLTAQLNKLAKMGVKRAIAALEHSVACGYQGIFESDKPAKEQVHSAPSLFNDSDTMDEHRRLRQELGMEARQCPNAT